MSGLIYLDSQRKARERSCHCLEWPLTNACQTIAVDILALTRCNGFQVLLCATTPATHPSFVLKPRPLEFNAHPTRRGVSCTSRDFWREKEWNTLTPFRTSERASDDQASAHRASPALSRSLLGPARHAHLMRTCPEHKRPACHACTPAVAGRASLSANWYWHRRSAGIHLGQNINGI